MFAWFFGKLTIVRSGACTNKNRSLTSSSKLNLNSIFLENVLVKEKNCQLALESSAPSRHTRQAPGDPKDYLDEEINFLIETIPAHIEKAKLQIEAGQRFKVIFF